jgi:hypothetical protein
MSVFDRVDSGIRNQAGQVDGVCCHAVHSECVVSIYNHRVLIPIGLAVHNHIPWGASDSRILMAQIFDDNCHLNGVSFAKILSAFDFNTMRRCRPQARDLLDHVIATSERHLKRLLSDYVRYYHEDRTHLGLNKLRSNCVIIEDEHTGEQIGRSPVLMCVSSYVAIQASAQSSQSFEHTPYCHVFLNYGPCR